MIDIYNLIILLAFRFININKYDEYTIHVIKMCGN